MLRTARTFALAALAAVALTACGTGASFGKIRTGTQSSGANTKDCSACKKMCEVGGSAEDNEKGVEACKKDCEKSCKQ